MIIMKHGLIDYSQTSFLLESYALGKSGVSKADFADFQNAVMVHDDSSIFMILSKYSTAISYYFDVDTDVNKISVNDKDGSI